MKKPSLSKWGVALLLCISVTALARDISQEQRAASDAREQYRQLNEDYGSVSKQVEDMEKYVAQVQAKLRSLRDKQSTTLIARDKARADMEAKEKIVDQLWDQRDK